MYYVMVGLSVEGPSHGGVQQGPSHTETDCVHNDDGSVDVTYLPVTAGQYAVHVLCDNEDIAGSPFMVDVQSPPHTHFDPYKVRIPSDI